MMKVYDYNKSIGRKVVTLSRLIGFGLNKKFKELDCPLTFQQWKIMTALNYQEGISQNQLAEIVEKEHTTVSKIVNTLIKKNMLRRTTDVNDKRTNNVFLTEEGREVLEKLATDQVQTFLDSLVDDISEAEVEIFTSVLERMIKKIQ